MSPNGVKSLLQLGETVTDEIVMSAVARGQVDSFEILVKRHQNRVYRMAYHMLGSEEDAWDASQEVFIKVYQARTTYVTNAKFTTWLYRIANNAIIDKLRQIRRKSMEMSSEDIYSEATTQEISPQAHIEWRELGEGLSQALSTLSERQRSMLILRYYEGFSVNEIAELFECATGTVKATIFQSLRNLRNYLNKGSALSREMSP